MKKYLIVIISLFLMPTLTSAATVSGEVTSKTTPTQTVNKTPQVKVVYYTGAKGGCYTIVKNQKTGKTTKRYVDKKFCKK